VTFLMYGITNQLFFCSLVLSVIYCGSAAHRGRRSFFMVFQQRK